MAVCWTLWSDSFQDSILQKKKKKKKHIHVWRNKVGQVNQSKDNESACNAGDLSSIPGLGRSPGGRPGNPLQYSCLENQRSLAGYSPWGCKESDTTGWLSSAQHKDNETAFPGGSDVKESACNTGNPGSNLWVRKIPWRREYLPTPVFLPGKVHGQRSQEGSSP